MSLHETNSVTLLCGDSRNVLRSLADNSVDSVVTDPPYALNFMGKAWDTGDVAFDVSFWTEVSRVLKPGGHLAAFSASRTYHRMACAIEDAGFEIRDSLMWIYGTGFPKGQDVPRFIDRALGVESVAAGTKTYAGGHVQNSAVDKLAPPIGTFARSQDDRLEYEYVTEQAREFSGFSTALKPAFEPIVLARKPLSEPTVAANVLKWRTGALNIDGCRVETNPEVDDPRLGGKGSWGTAKMAKNVYEGGYSGERVTSSALGRWPANVVTDGSDEVVGMFPTAGGQQGRAKIGGAKGGSIYGNFGENFSSNPEPRGDSGSAARFFYSAKASKADRAGSKHPTVKPIALMAWLVRLTTPPGGTVLDPFAGSGTTGAAAHLEGFRSVLIESEAEYQSDIRNRVALLSQASKPKSVAPAVAPVDFSKLKPKLPWEK